MESVGSVTEVECSYLYSYVQHFGISFFKRREWGHIFVHKCERSYPLTPIILTLCKYYKLVTMGQPLD